MSSPFRRVVDDLTAGCGCACHTGIGYKTACEHCRPSPVPTLTLDEAGVERLGLAMEQACDALGVTSLCPADAAVLMKRLRGEG